MADSPAFDSMRGLGVSSRGILVQLYPAQAAKVDEAYAAALKPIPEGSAKTDGITIGERAAATSLPTARTTTPASPTRTDR